MSKFISYLKKPEIAVLILFVLASALPNKTLGPWNLFNLQKIAMILFSLSLIQILGAYTIQTLGTKAGSILTGFFGGLVSSTATTAALARESKHSALHKGKPETLTFLATTLAMLAEGIAILLLGSNDVNLRLLWIFVGPMLLIMVLIFLLSRQLKDQNLKLKSLEFNIFATLKLGIIIIGIITFSKLLQNLFGKSSLFLFTFLTSLFEIHGSLIANLQLHANGSFDTSVLGSLVAVAIAASFVSKLFLVYAFGSTALKDRVVNYTALLLLVLLGSWGLFYFS